jgi:hypothetical protein
MSAPNANPHPCGGITVNCCPQGLPETLLLTFSGANVCGNPPSMYVKWDPVNSRWSGLGAGCNNANPTTVTCTGNSCTNLSLSWSELGPCMNTFTLTSCVCDGPNGFQLVFSVKQTSTHCPCCPANTTYTVTVTPGMPI